MVLREFVLFAAYDMSLKIVSGATQLGASKSTNGCFD
jgi:hypothetical protein